VYCWASCYIGRRCTPRFQLRRCTCVIAYTPTVLFYFGAGQLKIRHIIIEAMAIREDNKRGKHW